MTLPKQNPKPKKKKIFTSFLILKNQYTLLELKAFSKKYMHVISKNLAHLSKNLYLEFHVNEKKKVNIKLPHAGICYENIAHVETFNFTRVNK